MGFVRKLTGIDAANRNANAQIAANREAAEAADRSAAAAASAAAETQRNIEQRRRLSEQATLALTEGTDTQAPTVDLSRADDEAASVRRRRTAAQFGFNQ